MHDLHRPPTTPGTVVGRERLRELLLSLRSGDVTMDDVVDRLCGASIDAVAPLPTILDACSPGIAVVNIDDGCGAGCAATRIDRDGAGRGRCR